MTKNGIDRTIGTIQSDISWLKDGQKEIIDILKSGDGKISRLRERVDKIETAESTKEKMSAKTVTIMGLIFTFITVVINVLFRHYGK